MPSSPYIAMVEMVLAQWTSVAISAAARLGVADHLESGPRTTKELASLMKVHEDALYRLLRALAGLGVFYEGENRSFSQTPLSELLRTNGSPTLRYAAAMMIDPWQIGSMQAINSTIENGQAAITNVFGKGLFEYLHEHPDEAFRFNRGMMDLSSGDVLALLAAYDFSAFDHIVDVGGGTGRVLAGILEKFPALRGTLFDQPSVIEQAKKDGILDSYKARCDFAGGSFFESVPVHADAYIMKHIIHDWEDEQAEKILRNCRRAMQPTGKLLVVDRVIGPPNAPDPRKFFDVAMMLIPGGRERTESEWNALFAASGFRVARIVPTPGPHSVIEGTPA